MNFPHQSKATLATKPQIPIKRCARINALSAMGLNNAIETTSKQSTDAESGASPLVGFFTLHGAKGLLEEWVRVPVELAKVEREGISISPTRLRSRKATNHLGVSTILKQPLVRLLNIGCQVERGSAFSSLDGGFFAFTARNIVARELQLPYRLRMIDAFVVGVIKHLAVN